MAVQPGDSVVIRCVTPWIGLVNAWKKDDVVLPSGQSGVAMTSVRLRQEEVKELIDKMAEMEEKEMGELAAKQNAGREEKLKSKASVKISLGENIQFKVGKVVGVEAHPDDYRKSKNEKSKEEKGEDSSEDSAKDASAEVEGDQEELEQDQKAVQKENGLTGPSAMARQHQKGRMQQHDAGNQHNRVKRQQRSQRGPSERLKAVFSQGQKLELWTLLIENVTTSDTGNYTCGGEAITNFQLRVRDQLENKATIELPESEILTNEEQTKFGLAVLVNPKLQKLILKCNYTGTEDHGDATYAWFKDDQPIQEGTKFHIETTGTASVLTVEDCNVDDAGNYKCKLRGEEATLRVLMYPTLEHVERSKNQVQGDPLTLTCKARGSPTPTIKWLKDGEPLIMDERMEKQDIDSVKDAKLIIRNLQYSDKGKYVCQATSLNVTTEVEINVRVKDKYAALWPFLGICAEVAILCTIIFIYEKRRTKPEFEDDDDKKESSSHRK
ncbi:basigin-like isoform X2 [Varroa destructor]|uniref:Ig-like domain-containing protein n=1 Tax=Varroa destructor TaxID=109461 RepID=A0A7M7KXB4_VARDE|nr:basigin-like isoform X2 [Varroa destructor]